jgi:benzoyl-CoA reductase subunit C
MMNSASTTDFTSQALDRFREVNSLFPETSHILEHKQQGKKVLGWLCTYVPEEIMHAADVLPIRITGYSHEIKPDEGNAYLYVNNCSFSRSCLQLGLRGGYDFLDGIAGGSTCDCARRLMDLWHHYIAAPFYHMITVPQKYSSKAHELYYVQIAQFTQHLSEFTNTDITDTALSHSIQIYNESRELLRKLYDLRKADNPPITGSEIIEIANAGFRMPKETFNEYLKSLLSNIDISRRAYSNSRARLMLTGSILGNHEFVESIEQLGGLVVTDDLCTSTRHWYDMIEVNQDESPLRAIARRYLNNFPCARMIPHDERLKRIRDLAQDCRVDGVISQIVHNCTPYTHELSFVTKMLEAQEIPVLSLDVEYGTASSGQIQTRVQAFLEMLEGKRK